MQEYRDFPTMSQQKELMRDFIDGDESNAHTLLLLEIEKSLSLPHIRSSMVFVEEYQRSSNCALPVEAAPFDRIPRTTLSAAGCLLEYAYPHCKSTKTIKENHLKKVDH